MLEIEMKFPVHGRSSVEARLKKLGATRQETRQEIDHYFNAPDRDFARTDEALRIRQVGDRNRITYKGPKLDADTKTRKEIEVPLADGENVAREMADLLQSLGYRPVASMRKNRTVYAIQSGGFPMEVCLDEVEGAGSFVELEIMAPDSEFDAARSVLKEMAQSLGLTASERRSYLELYLERKCVPS